MPKKVGPTLKDPVGAIARGIARVDARGHADTRDFVLEAVRLLDLKRDDELIEVIANALFEDAGEFYATEQQMAAYIYRQLMGRSKASPMIVTEPSDLELAMYDRIQMKFPAVGPLTREQAEEEEAYARYCEGSLREYEAEQAAGGRTICPSCGERSVTHRSVITLGYAGHPGAEYSNLASCERCTYREL